MPWPSVTYQGGQDEDLTRSIDNVHIEPSIREGVHMVSSLYGRDASRPLTRVAPTNTALPWIRATGVIPEVMTCEEGTWTGEPSPLFDYQWMSDGADIPGATSRTWTSTVEYTDTEITVEVRGYNTQGQAYAISTPMTISVIEPIEVFELENMWISGLTPGAGQVTHHDSTAIVSGISALGRFDVNRAVAYFTTGTSAPGRNDVNAKNVGIVTGLESENQMTTRNAEGIAVINYMRVDPLEDSVPVLMHIVNPDAEMGAFGWDVFGRVTWTDSSRANGLYAWMGGEDVDAGNANLPYVYHSQDLPIEPVWEADVDAGLCFFEQYWEQRSSSQLDQANIRCEFLDVNKISLGVDSGAGMWASPPAVWFGREFEVAIPPNTRYIRIFCEFNLQSGTDNNAMIDAVRPYIRKGVKIVSRDFGPSFDHWRIRFTTAGTYPGGALSEIEFRDSIGGADLLTGGTLSFGSAGLGVANADFAIDDLRNTGYWAGSLNAIAEGTSWLAYEKAAPWRPQEIDITARLGGDSLQVPSAFYIEGSDDGINWTPVQYYPEEWTGGDYSSGQQRQFEVFASGSSVPYWTDFAGGSYSYTRDQFSGDDERTKGNVYVARSRFDLTHIRAVHYNPNNLAGQTLRLAVAKLSTERTGINSWDVGFISEVHEIIRDVPFVSTGLTNYMWTASMALSTPMEVEVGEYFVVIAIDDASNPDDANEGRIPWVTSWNGMISPYDGKRQARFVQPWVRSGGEDPFVGQLNNTSFNESRYWGVDFQGTVF